MQIHPHKLFNAFLLNFSMRFVHLSKSTVLGHAFKAWGPFLAFDALEPHVLQSKKRQGLPTASTVLRSAVLKFSILSHTSGDMMSTLAAKKNPCPRTL